MPIKTATKPEQQLPGENPASNPGIGHNKPPPDEEARAAFREELLRERPDFEQRVEDIIAASDRVAVTDDHSYGLAGDFIKMCRAAQQHVASAHKAAKQPYLDGGRAVDAVRNALDERIAEARDKAQSAANTYAVKKAAEERAERERREAEARAAAEAAANAEDKGEAMELAPAPVKKAEPVRSDGGATISTKSIWNSKVKSYPQAFKAVESDPKVKEAIDAAIARLVRAGQREITGVDIWETQQAVAR